MVMELLEFKLWDYLMELGLVGEKLLMMIIQLRRMVQELVVLGASIFLVTQQQRQPQHMHLI